MECAAISLPKQPWLRTKPESKPRITRMCANSREGLHKHEYLYRAEKKFMERSRPRLRGNALKVDITHLKL